MAQRKRRQYQQHVHYRYRRPRGDPMMQGMMDMGRMAVGGMVVAGTIGVIGNAFKPST